jgi:copper(I)-binding protein
MNRSLWSAAALGLAALGPAGCGEAPDEAEAAAGVPAGIAVTNARLMLPAVAGNPGALYFDVANSGAENRVIRAVSIVGAGSAEMHTKDMQLVLQVAVPQGGSTKFEPGQQHVMAMKLADTVTAGSKADVTVTFVGGDKVTFPADVRAAGEER